MTTVSRRMTLTNKSGLHARPISQIVELSSQFGAELTVSSGERSADGSSILALMSLGAGPGSELEFSAEGDDAEALIAAMAELVAADFHE